MFPSPVATRDEGKVFRITSGASTGVLALSLPAEPRAVAWDRHGIIALCPGELVLFADDGAPRGRAPRADAQDEPLELCAMDAEHFAVAGTSPRGAWIEVRARADGTLLHA